MTRALVSMAALLVACGGTPTSEPERPTSAEMAPAMDEHFSGISSIQQAVIRGELQVVHTEAQRLASRLKNADHPHGWELHLHAVRSAVWRVVRASDLSTAAAATANAAHACGTCHEGLGITVAEADLQPPSRRPDNMSDYMFQHLWAAEQMWAGLVGPSDEAWRAGATVLAGAGLLPDAGKVRLDDAMVELAARLNKIGRRASEVDTEQRPELYGEFLGTCASCHRNYLDRVD